MKLLRHFVTIVFILALSALNAADGLPYEVGNREGGHPTDEDLLVFAKMFCSRMQTHYEDKNANALRAFFDPRYLKKHGLTDRDLSAELAGGGGIYNILVADDKETILCLMDTRAHPTDKGTIREAIILRVSVHEGNLYLSPLKAPDPKSGVFAPWILRTKAV